MAPSNLWSIRGVVFGESLPFLFGICHSMIRESPLAILSFSSVNAVNELLFAQFNQLRDPLNLSMPLDTSCGSERPAGSALSLVLNCIYRSLGSPVNRLRNIAFLEAHHLIIFIIDVVKTLSIPT